MDPDRYVNQAVAFGLVSVGLFLLWFAVLFGGWKFHAWLWPGILLAGAGAAIAVYRMVKGTPPTRTG